MTRRAGASVDAADQSVAVQHYAEELRAKLPR